MADTWQDVARVLAERMQHHAHCKDHAAMAADPNCPYCEDRAAYRRYLAKANRLPAPRQEDLRR